MGKERWSRKTARPALPIVGFGLLLAWTYVVFFSRLVHFSTRNSIEHLNSTYLVCLLRHPSQRSCSTHCPGTACRCIGTEDALTVRRLLSTRRSLSVRRWPPPSAPWRSPLWSMTSCASLGAPSPPRSRASPARRRSSGGPTGLFTARGSQSFVWLSLSFVCGAAVFFITLSLPAPAALGVTYCLPVASAIMLNTSGIDDRREHEAKALPSRTMPVFLRMLLSLFLIGLAESLVRALFLEVDPGTQSLAYQTLFLVAMLCAALAVTCASRYRKNPAQALNRVALFVLVVLSLLAPIVMGVGIWGDLPALICYGLFYLFTWATLSQVTRVFKLPARFAFGWGLGMAYAGCLAGTFFGSLLASYVDLSYKARALWPWPAHRW